MRRKFWDDLEECSEKIIDWFQDHPSALIFIGVLFAILAVLLFTSL